MILTAAPSALRVEHLVDPIGLIPGPDEPVRLSWRLPPGASRQIAFQLRTDGWISPRIESSGHLLVPYPGPRVLSGERVTWYVRVWTDLGESEWSRSAFWELGLVRADDWSAHWISPAEPTIAPLGARPGYRLRTTFELSKPVRRARLYATARGIYEAFVNGNRVGDLELTPGLASGHGHLQVHAFDVTKLVDRGENSLDALITDGQSRGAAGFETDDERLRQPPAFLAQLDVEFADRTHTVIGTNDTWQSQPSEILSADLTEGEIVDNRLRVTDLQKGTVSNANDWSAVNLSDVEPRLTGTSAPPLRRVREFRPRSIVRVDEHRQIVDLGQKISGWVRLAELGARGTEITLRYSDALGARDVVIASGTPGESFEPRHSTHSFQYVEIDGAIPLLAPDDVAGIVVQPDLTRTGWFSSSDDRLNAAYEAAVWGLDAQQLEPSAALVYDIAALAERWLRDREWDEAAFAVAGEAYLTYGDKRFLREDHDQRDSMTSTRPLAVLADAGHLEVAYDLLRDSPADSLLRFLHSYVGGIQPLSSHPGYQRFRIAPRPGGELRSATVTFDSPYGRIVSAWSYSDDEFALRVEVPAGTRALVVLPSGVSLEAGPGCWRVGANGTLSSPDSPTSSDASYSADTRESEALHR